MNRHDLGITNEQWKRNLLIWTVYRINTRKDKHAMLKTDNRNLDGIFTCMECDRHANPVLFELTERNGMQHIAILCVRCGIKDDRIRQQVDNAMNERQQEKPAQ